MVLFILKVRRRGVVILPKELRSKAGIEERILRLLLRLGVMRCC
jgi:bifunctional DNA-binding transcriptional regulator/antitoxin component of YhaV-PrlF toxin-antitoxin module